MFSIANTSYSQELSSERKLYNLHNLEIEIFKLPYDVEYIKDTLFVEVVDNRMQLAPHYPDISVLPRTKEARDNAYYSWIDLYPTEFDNYFVYLRTFIHAHKN